MSRFWEVGERGLAEADLTDFHWGVFQAAPPSLCGESVPASPGPPIVGFRGPPGGSPNSEGPCEKALLLPPVPWAPDPWEPSLGAPTSLAKDPGDGSPSAAPCTKGMGTQVPSARPYLSGPGVHPQLLGQRQEGRQLLAVQEQVDGHPAAGGSIHHVQKQVWVGEYVHDDSHQLGAGRGAVRGRGAGEGPASVGWSHSACPRAGMLGDGPAPGMGWMPVQHSALWEPARRGPGGALGPGAEGGLICWVNKGSSGVGGLPGTRVLQAEGVVMSPDSWFKSLLGLSRQET